MNVAMIDLLTQVPYYDRYLAEAIAARVDEFCLYAVRFHREPTYYDNMLFKRSPGLTDAISSAPIRARRVRQLLRAGEYALNLLALLARFHRGRPDVVHIQWLPMLGTKIPVEMAVVKHIQRMGIPIVYTVHNYLPHDTGERYFAIYKHMYDTADHLVVHTAADQQRLIADFGIPAAKVSLIGQGPAFADQTGVTPEEARKALGLAPDDTVLLMLGVIRPYKGIEPVLEALGRLNKEQPNPHLKLFVAGGTTNPAYLHSLQAQAEAQGIAQMVRWQTEYVPSDQMGLYHAAADVVLFPYHDISQSAAFLTAGGLGKCTLTTAVGGLAELVQDGVHGVQIESSDPAQVADGLRRCLALSAEERRAMGSALQARLDVECNWGTIGQQTVDLYEQVIRQPATRNR